MNGHASTGNISLALTRIRRCAGRLIYTQRGAHTRASGCAEECALRAQGPLYFLSLPTAKRLVTDAGVLHHATLALDAAEHALIRAGQAENTSGTGTGARATAFWQEAHRPTAIWEDVFLGYMLNLLKPAPALGVVTIDWESYSEQWGLAISTSSLVWHAKTKDPDRLRIIDAWKRVHHCTRLGAVLGPALKTTQSCNGGTWPLFRPSRNTSCSAHKVDLKALLLAEPAASASRSAAAAAPMAMARAAAASSAAAPATVPLTQAACSWSNGCCQRHRGAAACRTRPRTRAPIV